MSDIIKKDPGYNPNRKELSPEEAALAAADLLVKYPSEFSQPTDEPIVGQTVGLVSFALRKEPITINGKNIYGFIKLRGNYGDKDKAVQKAQTIIKDQDSKFKIVAFPVGQWVPVTDDEKLVREMIDVPDENSDSPQLRTQDINKKKKELERQAKEFQDKEDERKMKEIEQRTQELKRPDPGANTESLDNYVMKRVSQQVLYDQIQKDMVTVKDRMQKYVECRILLESIEMRHPNYCDKWIDRYNEERQKSGIRPFVQGEANEKAYRGWLPSGISFVPNLETMIAIPFDTPGAMSTLIGLTVNSAASATATTL